MAKTYYSRDKDEAPSQYLLSTDGLSRFWRSCSSPPVTEAMAVTIYPGDDIQAIVDAIQPSWSQAG